MRVQSVDMVDHAARARAHEVLSTREEKLPPEALRQLAEEVIARLASRFATPAVQEPHHPDDEAIDALADALISPDSEIALDSVLALKQRGVPRDTVYLGYIAGAARRLGERWERDELGFMDVTLGAGRLYGIIRALRPTFVADFADPNVGARALFAAAPGEDHTLGVVMATDMFRERGWKIDLETDLDHDQLVEAAAVGRYPVIGLSASSEKMIVPLTRLIASLRVTTPGSAILVSGELTTIEPDLADIVDADSIVQDAKTAISEMDRLIGLFPPMKKGARHDS